VDIDTPVTGQIQNVFSENLPERRDNNQVRIPDMELFHGFWLTELFRLNDWNVQFLRKELDRRRSEFAPASRGPVWLSDDPDNLILCGQRFEDRQRKIR
jgi:hypothetical protein